MEFVQTSAADVRQEKGLEALAFFSRAYASRVDLRRNSQGRTVGYLSPNVPIELIRAAGCSAIQLHAEPGKPAVEATDYMEECFDQDIRAVFERFLRGDFDHLDLVIIPRSSEGLLQLYYYLNEVTRLEPERRFPPLHLFDVLHTPYRLTGRYVEDQVRRLRDRLQSLTGRTIDASSVEAEISIAQKHCHLLARVNAMRHETPAKLSGTQALEVFGSIGTTPCSEHAQALEALLDSGLSSHSFHGPRLMVKGSIQHSLDFYRRVESLGAVIVADDHLAGDLSMSGPFDESLDPFLALAHHYHRRSPSVRSFPQSRQDATFVERLQVAKVDGVIFCYDDTDDTYGWEYPDQKALLEKRGIPSLLLFNRSMPARAEVDTDHATRQFVQELTVALNQRTFA
jgi:benzoyl-CoA reductase/2-hydroxyglutaryl-CoA dehydratase subunit BcrC/BadD/HgdB